MSSATTPKVGVLVLNWNGRQLLEDFAPSWVSHTPDYAELVIIDNGSTDESLSFLQSAYPEVKVLAFEENYGFAEGYNRAIAALDYPYVVLLNSDAALSEGWLDEALELLETEPELGAVQPKIRALRSPEAFEYAGAAGGYIDALGYPFCRGRLLDTVEVDEGQYDQPAELLWASGACLIVRRSVYLELGGLDTRFFAHQEEIDLCWRMVSRGWRIRLAPSGVVYHLGGGSLSAESPRKVFLNFRNNLLMLYKNLPTPRLYLVLLLRLILDAVAALVYLLQGRGRHAVAVLRAWRGFLILRPHYELPRGNNMRARRTDLPLPLKPYSLLLHYYLLGHRRYSQLP